MFLQRPTLGGYAVWDNQTHAMFSRCFFVFFLPLLALGQGQPGQAENKDPLGRTTPRGAVFGFMRSAHSQDYARAAQYLDTPLKGQAASQLADHLSAVLDRGLPANLDALSDKPDGELNDRLPLSKELVGVIPTSGKPLEVHLDRVRRSGEMIWLFSADTLRRVPEVYDEMSEAWIDEYIPKMLTRRGWLAVPLWQWLALLIGISLGVGISAVPTRITGTVLRRLPGSFAQEEDHRLLHLLAAPLRALVLLGVIELTVSLLKLPFGARLLWNWAGTKLAIIAVAWLFLRVVRVLGQLVSRRVERVGKADTTAVVRLIQRTVNVFAVFLVFVILLHVAGYNVTAVLAGLGVGGIAIAFAAQKTLENLFGGVSIIFDKPIRVGDSCRIGDQSGTVVDIGLRSTRFRTDDRTMLTVPNGQLSVMNLENFGMRDKIRFRHIVSVSIETKADQMRRLLDSLHKLLAEHPMVERSTARVRLVRFGASSMDIEVFAYVLTLDGVRFLEVQEELLLHILDAIESNGAAVAVPSQVLITRNAAGDSQPARQGEESKRT